MSADTPEVKSEMNQPNPPEKSKRSLRIVLQKGWDVPFLANIVSIAVPLLAGFLAAWLWFESTLNAKVEQRIAPYEYYLNGAALVTDREYDRAVPELEKAFNLLGKRFDER